MSYVTVIPFRNTAPEPHHSTLTRIRELTGYRAEALGVLRDFSNDASAAVVNTMVTNWLGAHTVPAYPANSSNDLADLHVTSETRAIVVSTPQFRKGTVLYEQVAWLLREGREVFAPATLNADVLPVYNNGAFNPFFINWCITPIDVRPSVEVRDTVIACEQFADGKSIVVPGIDDSELELVRVPVSGVSVWKWYDYIAKHRYLVTDNPWLACLFGAVRGMSSVCCIGGIRLATITGASGALSSGWVNLIRDSIRRKAQCQSS